MLYKRGFTRTVSFDGLNYHNWKKFSTYDNNNDKAGAISAITFLALGGFLQAVYPILMNYTTLLEKCPQTETVLTFLSSQEFIGLRC